MSNFTDLVLALNPIHFSVVYNSLGMTVIEDLSPNGTDGTFDPSATFGLPSPIETDPASSSVGGAVGSIPALDGSLMDQRGNLTVIGFAYYDSALADTIHLWGRRQQFGQSNGNQAGINGGVITSHLTLDTGGSGTFYPLNDPIAPVVGNFYMITQVRNGAVHNLYTNDRLANTRSDLTIDPIGLIGGSNLPWWIGRSENSGAFPGLRTCSFIVFDYALNTAQVQSVYAASINQLLLAGRSDVVVTSTLSSTTEPDPISFPWRHNWDTPLIERLSFATAIASARTGKEEANEQRATPRREFEFTQVLKSNPERRKLRAQLWANQHAKWLFPVRQDAEQLSAAVIAGATTIPADTVHKDYEVGGYIGLRQLHDNGTILHWEEKVITAVNPASVECAAIDNNYSARLSWVYPVKRVLIPRSLTIKGHTDSVEELTVTAQLLPEDEAVIPHRLTPWTPTLKYRDHEVWDIALWPSNDWSETRDYEVSRETSDIDFSVGLMGVDTGTGGASETLPWRIKVKGRDTIAAFLGWFYERRGMSRYLWIPTEQDDFEVLDAEDEFLTVADTNYSDSFALAEPRRDIAFIYHDKTMEFRRVVGFSSVTNEVLELDAPVPTLTNLRMVSLLKFCRLDGDQVEIAWHTDDTVEIAWSFREMLHSPEGVGVSSLSPSASLSPSLSPSASASPSSSASLSRSPSASTSPSASLSPSGSVSPSSSASLSQSPSSSTSPSASGSPTPSASPSPST